MTKRRRKLGIQERIFNGAGKKKLKPWLEILAKKFGRLCVKCKTTKRLTVNHKIPRYIGGKDEESNLEIMCLSCNVKTFHELRKTALMFYFEKQDNPIKL